MNAQVTNDLLQAILTATDQQKTAALRTLRGENAEPSVRSERTFEPYVTLVQLAAQLNFHPATLWRWGIPKHELAGRPRFKVSEVVAYLESPDFKTRARALRRSRRTNRSKS